MKEKLLKLNFEYRVEISYIIFIFALLTLLIDTPLLYQFIATHFNLNQNFTMSILFYFIAFGNLVAGILRVWACAYISSNIMMKKEINSKILVTNGPYAYVRNPIYLADILSMFFTSLAGNIYSVIVLTLGKIITSYLFCIYEEQYLLKTYNKEYEQYFLNVPRFVPKLTPYKLNNSTVNLNFNNYIDGLNNSFYPFGITLGFLFGGITNSFTYMFLISTISAIIWFLIYRIKRFNN